MWIVVRAAGAACIMASCMLTGIGLELRVKKRWRIFREFQELLTYLEKETACRRTPIHEALREAAAGCTSELAQALVRAADQIERRDGGAFAGIWEAALAESLPERIFSGEELRLMEEISAAMCSADVVLQRALLDKYADRFRMMSAREAELLREKGGLYRRLAAAAGVFLVLALL